MRKMDKLHIDSLSKLKIRWSKMTLVCFSNIDAKCYCEHQNETSPLNGIICGSEGSIHRRAGYCRSHERCIGSSDRNQGVEFSKKGQLCSIGQNNITFDVEIYKNKL